MDNPSRLPSPAFDVVTARSLSLDGADPTAGVAAKLIAPAPPNVPGATFRYLRDRAGDRACILDYNKGGSPGTGQNDDTSNILAMLRDTSAAGRAMDVPKGRYLHGPIDETLASPITLLGEGVRTSQFVPFGVTGIGMRLRAPAGLGFAEADRPFRFCGFDRVGFDGASSPALTQALVLENLNGIHVGQIGFDLCNSGLTLKGCYGALIEYIFGRTCKPGTGVLLTIDGIAGFTIVKVDYENAKPRGYNWDCYAGILVKEAYEGAIMTGMVAKTRCGLAIEPDAGKDVADLSVGVIQFDQISGPAIRMRPAAGGRVVRPVFLGTWGGSAETAFEFSGDGKILRPTLSGVRASYNVRSGLDVRNASGLSIGGSSQVTDNGNGLSGRCKVELKAFPNEGQHYLVTLNSEQFGKVFQPNMSLLPIVINGRSFPIEATLSDRLLWVATNSGLTEGDDLPFTINAGTAYAGIDLGAGVSDVEIKGSAIVNTNPGNLPDVGPAPTQAYGVRSAAGAGDRIDIVGNSLRGNTGGALSLSHTGKRGVIADNAGVDDEQGVATIAAGVLTVPLNRVNYVAGSGNITSISARSWVGRELRLLASASDLTFVAGNNLLNGLTVAQGGYASALFEGSKWVLK